MPVNLGRSIAYVVTHDLGSMSDLAEKKTLSCKDGFISLASLIHEANHLDIRPSHLVFKSIPDDLPKWAFQLQSEKKIVEPIKADRLVVFPITQDLDPNKTLVKWSWQDKSAPFADNRCHDLKMTLAI